MAGGAGREKFCVPSMFGDYWGASPLTNLMEVKDSEAQGRNREGSSERSVEQRREPMNKNRIEGRQGGRSGKWQRSPYPSRPKTVNPAVVR